MKTIEGHIADVMHGCFRDGSIILEAGTVVDLEEHSVPADAPYIVPGFIDSHVHIESSMSTPANFAATVVRHGTTGVVTDPHEIANVLGVRGIDFMLDSASRAKFNFAFGAPSCVPSCSLDFETSGAVIDSGTIKELMARDDIRFLSEMMDYPGVLNRNPEVLAKISAAKEAGKPVDGHAPFLSPEDRAAYAGAGISTDHEIFDISQARDCIADGIKILIREGSAARNFDALHPLIGECPGMLMFCTDDFHPEDLVQGHINELVRRALILGYDLWDVLTVACVTPILHYGLDWGLLRTGDRADFILLSSPGPDFSVLATYIGGEKVYDASRPDVSAPLVPDCRPYPNRFDAAPVSEEMLRRELREGESVPVIIAYDGSLLTSREDVTVTGGNLPDDINKIAVYCRYRHGCVPQVGYIRGFGLKDAAIASSVAHDCHNIVAIGSDDEKICRAVNRIVAMKGGMVAVDGDGSVELPLPVAGIISPEAVEKIASISISVNSIAKKAGCTFASPFLTMAFMCLPVIPHLKMTDKGLFDSEHFCFVRQ